MPVLELPYFISHLRNEAAIQGSAFYVWICIALALSNGFGR